MIRLFLVDDHAVVREGVKRILADVPDIIVVGEAGHVQEALAMLAVTACDVVLLDISLPDGHNGFEVLQYIRKTHPTLPVLVFSVHPERQYVIRAFQYGATGYLLKSSAPQQLVSALQQVVQGKQYVCPVLVEHLVSVAASLGKTWPPNLSQRERQVLDLLASGAAMKEIASELSLNAKTVSTYRRRLLAKLHLRTTADLIRYAIEQPEVAASASRRSRSPVQQ